MGRIILAIFLATMLVGCGSDDKAANPDTPPPVDGGNNGGGGNGGGTDNGKGGTCVSPAPAVNIRVLYGGPQGSGAFPDAEKDYFGKIVTIYSNATAKVEWEHDGSFSVVTWANLRTEGKCDPDLTNKGVLYTGTQGGADFPDPTGSYTGKILRVYAGGFAEIDWDHLTYTTAEPFGSVALEQ